MLLRPGGVPRKAIEKVLRRGLSRSSGESACDEPAAHRHAARAWHARLALCAAHAVRLDAGQVAPGEALLAFGAALPNGAEQAVKMLNLSARGDLIEAAANLFSHLRALDAVHATGHCGDADPARRSRRGDQRPARARGEPAIGAPMLRRAIDAHARTAFRRTGSSLS